MKHNLLKSVIISVILLMGVSNAWAEKGFFGDGQWNIAYWDGSYDGWGNSYNNASNFDLGIKTTLYLKNGWVKTWSNNDWTQSEVIWYWGWTSGSTTNNWKAYKSSQKGDLTWDFDITDYDLIGNAPNNPGHNTLYMYWRLDDYVSSSTSTVTFTIPGFTSTNTSKTFSNTTVGSNSSQTISFGTHYGTALTTSNCTITGTNKSDFSVTNISESGVTVKFAPTTAGNKSATLTIKDAHGKTCTITLNGKTQYTVTYSIGNNGTGNNQTAYKVYGTNLTLKDKGIFTRTGYTQTAWNTNADGKSGNSYALKASYTTEAAITLYPTWTANQSTITWNANGGSVTPASSTYTYDGDPVALPTPTRTGYTFNGWFTASSGGTKISDIGKTNKPTSNTTYYAQWTENKYTVNIVANPVEAAKTLTSGPKQVGINAVSITTTTNIGYQFVNWTATDGITITNPNNASTTIKATKAGTVTANFEAQPATTIYLEPTGHWNADKAVFQAHVWQTGKTGVNLNMEGVGDPSHADGDNKSPYRYYKVEVPYGYDKILFFRKDNFATANEDAWNKTGNLTIPTDDKVLYTITSTGKGKAEGYDPAATGVWKEANLVYTITLGYCDFGTYGFKYNGQSYFSKRNENVTLDVPAGAQIEILEGQPFSNAYTGDVIKAKPTKEELTTGQTLTINGDITLDDNFVTKTSHVVYLGVPDGLTDWTSGTYGNFLWSWNTMSSFSLIASTRNFKIGNTTYYEYTIPAGRHSLCFQRKTGVNDNGTPQKESVYLPFQIPLNEVNCFTLQNEKDGSRYKGTWGVLPAQPGDYRLLYVEQVVEKSKVSGDEWKTVITRKKAHPSNIIKKGTTRQIVSLHTYKDRKYAAQLGDGSTYESSNNPEIILQKYLGDDQWEDVECQMVYGPLETLPIMANLPGRKNASSNSNIDDLQHQDGIENIKNDDHPDQGNGVWNFVVTQDNAGKASVQWDQTHRYTGEYYIRTDNAEGRWDQYTLNDNYMTYSQYAKDHSGFSHYFCRWVEVSKDDNTKFVIANDYGIAISDTLAKDDYTNEHGDIAHDANIRWSWNMVNNEIARAYIQGTWDVSTSTRNRNLVVNYKSSSTAVDQEDLLDDSGDWIYQKDFTVKVGSHLNSLTAQYPVTTGPIQTFAENLDMLTGNPANTNEYKVRILYDFKINKTLVALVPDNGKSADIAIDVIIERVDQGPATQVQAQVNATRTEGSTVYAVMSFTKDHITGGASKYAKQFYWISFPFDVRVSDVFGFGEYGKHWIIQWYDGAERARKGCWIDSPTYWRFQTDTTNYVLEAGKGYVLTLDLAEMNVFTNTDQVSLYFPSRNTVKTVDGEIIHELNTTTLAPYTCTIQRNDRYIKDSHWHMLGVPSYANKNKSFTQNDVAFFYQYNSENDTYTPTSSGSFNFNSMFSYMVQFAGTINWSEFTFIENGGQGLAAKRNTDNANDKHVLRLELQKNSSFVDQTFVQLQAEEATEMFDMNLDLTKMINSGNNIYSLIPGTESNIEVAANAMPIKETIIPLGVKITAAGEYTFAMPDGTDGIVVELIDYETNTTTNLLLDNYTVNLGKGTFENRFALHVQPSKVTTSVEDITSGSDSQVRKYLIDGILYMQKDGVLYDAQGHCVK